MKRQARLIALLAVTTIVIAAGIIWNLTPIYTATALVMVDPADRNPLLPQHQPSVSSPDARMEGEVLLARSDQVLLTVIDRENLLTDPDFGTHDLSEAAALQKLASATSTRRHRASYLMSISVSDENAERAARLANAIARVYIDAQLAAKIDAMLQAGEVLRQQLALAQQSLATSDGFLDRYIAEHLDGLVAETGNTQIATLQQQRNVLDINRQSALAEILKLRSQSGSPVMDSAVADLQRTVEQSATQDTQLRQNLYAAVLGGPLTSATLARIYELQQRSEVEREQYDQMVFRSEQLDSEASMQLADSRIASLALIPNAPIFPNKTMLLLAAGVCGLAFGIGAALLREHLRAGVNSAEQLAMLSGQPRALVVPLAKFKTGQLSLADNIASMPLSPFSEAIRRLKAHVEHQKNGVSAAKVIVVTSATPGEGKTTTALALARSYAAAGRPTLLVDADLHRPSLHRHIEHEPRQGFRHALGMSHPDIALKDVLVADRTANLTVLVGSYPSQDATEPLITGQTFKRLLQAASRAYEVIVIDTPPIGAVGDAQQIAAKADVVVFLTQWAVTGQVDVRQALAILREVLTDETVLVPVLVRPAATGARYRRETVRGQEAQAY